MRILRIIPIVLIISGLTITAGCGGEQSTLDEPDITVGYLAGEYANQLVRDGAKSLFGSISIYEDEEGAIWIDLVEKEVVEDQTRPDGFYIAHKNLEGTYQLSPEARATFIPGGSSEAETLDAYEFVERVFLDLDEYGSGNPEYAENKLYGIYVIGDQVELLIAWYRP